VAICAGVVLLLIMMYKAATLQPRSAQCCRGWQVDVVWCVGPDSLLPTCCFLAAAAALLLQDREAEHLAFCSSL
jgi:hypothetical protein